MTLEKNFIDDKRITEILAKTPTVEEIQAVLEKSKECKGLSFEEVGVLLNAPEKMVIPTLAEVAGKIKNKIYGNRVVLFAPLYISNYCVNNCTYCGYARDNDFKRRRLNKKELIQEVEILEDLGHKRLALEVGEDPINAPIDYVIDAINTIYATQRDNGEIRRINVNIAATTREDYKKLHDVGIGTYILFQETYHKPTYDKVHPNSLKGDYIYHLNSFHRAQEAGIDDVGAGALFGLYDYRYEVLGLLMHNKVLEDKYGVGFHTVSVPRIKKAKGMELSDFKYLVNDDQFRKIVMLLRVAMPYVGIILSTRESEELRRELINAGVSQISAGSCTGVGGYKESEMNISSNQFETDDNRSPLEVLKALVSQGFIPSYCTACYRSGRTGDRFMSLAKSGQIGYICTPNALMTFMEYLKDYGDAELKEKGEQLIWNVVDQIDNQKVRTNTIDKLNRIKQGERDLYV